MMCHDCNALTAGEGVMQQGAGSRLAGMMLNTRPTGIVGMQLLLAGGWTAPGASHFSTDEC